MKKILSKQNNFIKDLKKQKDRNKFLLFLDNPKTVLETINLGVKLEHLLIDIDKISLAQKFEKFNPIFVSKEIIKQLSDTTTPQGIVGVFKFSYKPMQKPENNYLILDNLQDPGNVGTLIRTALGANFKDIFLINSVSATNPKVFRSSMGSLFKVNLYQTNTNEFVEFARENNLFILGCDMGGENIFKTDIPNNIGVIIGNEGNGISNELKPVINKYISIPMENNLESLNAGVAGSVVMYEIKRRSL